jgi:hypothetical protein
MPPLIANAPWWANALLVLVALVGVPLVTARIAGRPDRQTLRQVAEDARTSAEQTANNHADAEHPNLRDELTAVLTVSRDAVSAAQSAAAATERVERFVRDVDTSVRALDHSIDRRLGISDRNLAEVEKDSNAAIERLRESIPRLIAEGLEGHVEACPLRHPDSTT